MFKKLYKRLKNRFDNIMELYLYRNFLRSHPFLVDADRIFTHLTPLEKMKLFELSSSIKNEGYALEIGSYLGASACFIADGLKNNMKVICIDTWENNAMSEGKRDTEQEFDENTKAFREKIIKIKGYSAKVVSQVRSITNTIDLLFIDGDHSYEGCKADWDLYSPFLKSGSIVIFHDIGWAEGVKRVIEEDVKPHLSHWDNLPNMFYGWMR